MASIRAFIKPSDGVFDEHATRAMGEAFDAARQRADGAGQAVYEAIAARIIAAAHRARSGSSTQCRIGRAGI
jgi:hypothetical protein